MNAIIIGLDFGPVVSVNGSVYLRAGALYLLAKAPADPRRYYSVYCLRYLVIPLHQLTLYERMPATIMMIGRLLRLHPSTSVTCCIPDQETKSKSLSLTREYQHSTTGYLLFDNGSYTDAVFEHLGTVALPSVYGLSQFSRSYRFGLKNKTTPEGQRLYIAIKEGVEIFVQAWDPTAPIYDTLFTLNSSSPMAHNWLYLDLFQAGVIPNGPIAVIIELHNSQHLRQIVSESIIAELADRSSIKGLPESDMVAIEKHARMVIERDYYQNSGSWTPPILLDTPTEMRPAYRQHVIQKSTTSILVEPKDSESIPNAARKRVTFSPDVVDYNTELRRPRSAYYRSKFNSNYVPGRYACPSKEGWMDTSFSNSRSRTIRQCKIFITQDPSDMELEKPPSTDLSFTNTRSRGAILQKLTTLAIQWVDRLLMGCRRGVVAEAERMINRCDAIRILRDSVNSNVVLEVRPFILERDKEQDAYLRRRKRGNNVERLLTFVNEMKSKSLIHLLGDLDGRLGCTGEEDQES